MKNNIVKPTIKVNQVYVRVCDGQKAFVRVCLTDTLQKVLFPITWVICQ